MLFHYSAVVILRCGCSTPGPSANGSGRRSSPQPACSPLFGGDLLTLATHLLIPGIQVKIEVYRQITELGLNGWDAFDPFAATFLARVGMLYLLILCLEPLQRHKPLHPPAAEDLRRGPRLVPAAGQRPRRRRTDARAALDRRDRPAPPR